MAENPELDAQPDADGKVDNQEGQPEPQLKESVDGQEPSVRDQLKSILDAHGVNTPDDFSSIVQESQLFKKRYGDSQNEVGELRRQVEALSRELTQRKPPRYDEFDDNQGIDLTQTMRGVVRDEIIGLYNNIRNSEIQARNQWNSQRQALTHRPNWETLQPEFDRAMQNPDIQGLMSTGQLTMSELFSRMNERYLVTQVQNLYNQLPDGIELTPKGQGGIGTEGNIRNRSGSEEEKKEKIIKAKQNKNPEAVIDALFDNPNDPILNIG